MEDTQYDTYTRHYTLSIPTPTAAQPMTAAPDSNLDSGESDEEVSEAAIVGLSVLALVLLVLYVLGYLCWRQRRSDLEIERELAQLREHVRQQLRRRLLARGISCGGLGNAEIIRSGSPIDLPPDIDIDIHPPTYTQSLHPSVLGLATTTLSPEPPPQYLPGAVPCGLISSSGDDPPDYAQVERTSLSSEDDHPPELRLLTPTLSPGSPPQYLGLLAGVPSGLNSSSVVRDGDEPPDYAQVNRTSSGSEDDHPPVLGLLTATTTGPPPQYLPAAVPCGLISSSVLRDGDEPPDYSRSFVGRMSLGSIDDDHPPAYTQSSVADASFEDSGDLPTEYQECQTGPIALTFCRRQISDF